MSRKVWIVGQMSYWTQEMYEIGIKNSEIHRLIVESKKIESDI